MLYSTETDVRCIWGLACLCILNEFLDLLTCTPIFLYAKFVDLLTCTPIFLYAEGRQ
jgi:hypothetical protein